MYLYYCDELPHELVYKMYVYVTFHIQTKLEHTLYMYTYMQSYYYNYSCMGILYANAGGFCG